MSASDFDAGHTQADGIVLESLLGQLEPGPLLLVAAGIADALSKQHGAGLLHTDLEPSQIMVSVATGRAWLAQAHMVEKDGRRLTTKNAAISPAYLAPERSGHSSSVVDGRADLYSLGVCLYQLATGQLPFEVNEAPGWIHAHMAARPIPPANRRGMPVMLQSILLKLLEKEPEERYQTASGLAYDLRECLAQLTKLRAEPSFPLGCRDARGQLSPQSALVGRSQEFDALGASLESVQRTGAPALALVSGTSGIGKSSLVRQFLARRLPSSTLVVSAKFEDRESDAPYGILMQPFRELLRWLLTRPAAELDEWKVALNQALGGNAGIVAQLLPELARILKIRAPEVQLSAAETKNRVFASLRRVLRSFASHKRPLVMFLDDLQWVDPASLALIEHLLLDPDLTGLLLIGAYREESVTAGDLVLPAIERLRAGGLSVRAVALPALQSLDVERMVADLLPGGQETTSELAHVIERKTGGNPFFVRQFLTALIEETFLFFDAERGAWAWDLPRIVAKVPTENLADLLLDRLARLPMATQSALEILGCWGTPAPAPMLAEIGGITIHELNERLRVAVQAEVVAETVEGYAFQHDRLQNAVYSRIPETERPARHLAIGRALKKWSGGGGDALFNAARQLNRASALLVDVGERVQLAELNISLAHHSRSTAAPATALVLLEQAACLLPYELWQGLPALSFELNLARAECAFLCGQHERAESLLAELAAQELETDRLGAVVCIQLDLYSASYRWTEAVDVGLRYLKSVGAPWQTFEQDELKAEYERLQRALGSTLIASLADAPALSSPSVRTTMEVCVRLLGPVAQTNVRLFALVLMHVATLSIAQGSCDLSLPAYANISTVLGPMLGEHDIGLEFGRLAARLAEEGENRFLARAATTIGVVVAPRAFDAHAGRVWLTRAREAADQSGDLVFSTVCRHYLVVSMLGSGAPLEEAEREADIGIDFAARHRFPLVADRMRIVRRLIRGLRDPGCEAGSLSDQQLDETAYERASGEGLERAYYWVRRLQARYFAGDFAGARDAARRTHELARTTPSSPYDIELWFFGALAEAACAEASDPAEALEEMAAPARELSAWAQRCPPTFANKAALVGAERARLTGSDHEAELGFERAAQLARQHRLIHEEALAHELSARFYAARGILSVARAKFLLARHCYMRWGALAKVRRLDAELETIEQLVPPLADALEVLDVRVVVSALQAVSSSLQLEKLIQALMTSALQHAAAERGLLVLLAGELRIRARATFDGVMIHVTPENVPLSPEALPESILRYVIRSGELVATRDGLLPDSFRDDSYFERQTVRSILCLPIVVRGTTIGAMYLENRLARQTYGGSRLSVLQLIASQAAISLENARLYAGIHDAQQRMARGERVSRTGSFSWRPNTQELEFSDELLNIYGIEGPPSISLLRERVHPDDRALFDAMSSDTVRFEGQTIEHRLAMPDGSIKHVTAIASRLGTDEYAGTVRDVTDAKVTEEALQRTQAALSDMTRLGSLAEMAAAIAHEVNQPIAGIGINASTCQHRLSDERLDLAEARAAVERIQRDWKRAVEVVQRMRALFSKDQGAKRPIDINDAISEVVVLSHSRIRDARAILRLELQDDLPRVWGDRVQLQQVVMNLLNNALDAMSIASQPRTLTIRSLLSERGKLRCEVEDNGVGVSEADRLHIFEPFHTTKRQGMGMGLSICRSIVSNHDGELALRENADGHGSTFYFVLPC